MNENDYEKIKEALEPLKQRVNILLGNDPNDDLKFNTETVGENKELKNKLKEEKLYYLGAFAWMLVWVGIMQFITQIITFCHHMGIGGTVVSYALVIPYLIALIGTFIIIRKGLKISKQNKDDYDSEIVQRAVREVLPNAICRPTGLVNVARLYHLGVVPRHTSVDGSYLLEFEKNGQKFFISNLTLRDETTDDDGHKKSRTVFSGQAYIMEYKSQLAGNVRIMTTSNKNLFHKEMLDGFKKKQNDEEKIETENISFNENFDVYATDSHIAFYCLSPYVMEQLLEMKKRYGKFGVAITGRVISIALNSDYILFQKPVTNSQIDKMSVENSKRELQSILQFAQRIEDSINGRVMR